MLKNKEKICITLEDIEILKSLGFTSTEILIVGVCLTLTDSCYCSICPNSLIISLLGLTERTFYYALEKLKKFGVTKANGRYDYSAFVKLLSDSVLDSNGE